MAGFHHDDESPFLGYLMLRKHKETGLKLNYYFSVGHLFVYLNHQGKNYDEETTNQKRVHFRNCQILPAINRYLVPSQRDNLQLDLALLDNSYVEYCRIS